MSAKDFAGFKEDKVGKDANFVDKMSSQLIPSGFNILTNVRTYHNLQLLRLKMPHKGIQKLVTNDL